jgi:hypothetical protein
MDRLEEVIYYYEKALKVLEIKKGETSIQTARCIL